MKYLILLYVVLASCKSSQVANEVNNPISNNVFVHYMGSMCEDIQYTGSNPRKGKRILSRYSPTQIYLILKFDNEKVTAIERYVTNYGISDTEINLSSHWELNNTEIKINFKPEYDFELNISLFGRLQFKYINEDIIGFGENWTSKHVVYTFINASKLDKRTRRDLKLRNL